MNVKPETNLLGHQDQFLNGRVTIELIHPRSYDEFVNHQRDIKRNSMKYYFLLGKHTTVSSEIQANARQSTDYSLYKSPTAPQETS